MKPYKKLSKHLIDNTFINTQCIMTHLDSKSGTLIDINQTNAKYYFDTVFLLVKKTDDPIPIEFYNLKSWQDVELSYTYATNNKGIYCLVEYPELY